MTQNASHRKSNAKIRFKKAAEYRGQQMLQRLNSQSSKSQTFKLRPIINHNQQQEEKKRSSIRQLINHSTYYLSTQMQNTEGKKAKKQTVHSENLHGSDIKSSFCLRNHNTCSKLYNPFNPLSFFFFPGTAIHNYTTCKRTLFQTKSSVHRPIKEKEKPHHLYNEPLYTAREGRPNYPSQDPA